ncbi:MAG TPA: peptidoglycan-binding domain-containing protein [Acetobacteraceae bacterium]|nr:peptidoglycan-binding domain-containing protein [Acetobacteraceae bacterium]
MQWLRFTIVAVCSAPLLVAEASAQAPQLTYVQPLGQAGVAIVQQRLKQTGAYAGRTDGIWGRESAIALERYQRAQRLQPSGQLNPATVATLGLNPADLLAPAAAVPPAAPAAAAEPLAPEVVRTIQGRLRQLGFYPGQIDGIWGPTMQAALERFQQGRGLQATGQLNPATVTALGLDPNNLAAPPVR